jgi:hypothetical protein
LPVTGIGTADEDSNSSRDIFVVSCRAMAAVDEKLPPAALRNSSWVDA